MGLGVHGYELAVEALARTLAAIDPQHPVGLGSLDVSFHRDDVGLRPIVPGHVTDLPASLDGKVVVLTDDVLFTGRTIRAVLYELFDFGRPASVTLAVLVDRGGRELPIQPAFSAARVALPRGPDAPVATYFAGELTPAQQAELSRLAPRLRIVAGLSRAEVQAQLSEPQAWVSTLQQLPARQS